MSVLFVLAFLLVAFILVGLILLQEGKGGGLTGNAAGMDQVMGARNPLRRWTVYFFILFVGLALGINTYYQKARGRGVGDIELANPEPPVDDWLGGGLGSPEAPPGGNGETGEIPAGGGDPATGVAEPADGGPPEPDSPAETPLPAESAEPRDAAGTEEPVEPTPIDGP